MSCPMPVGGQLSSSPFLERTLQSSESISIPEKPSTPSQNMNVNTLTSTACTTSPQIQEDLDTLFNQISGVSSNQEDSSVTTAKQRTYVNGQGEYTLRELEEVVPPSKYLLSLLAYKFLYYNLIFRFQMPWL